MVGWYIKASSNVSSWFRAKTTIMAKFKRASEYDKSKSRPFDRDSYETSHATLDVVLNLLDPDKHYIFEPFPGTGYSTTYMRERGFIVTNGDYEDFFHHMTPPKVPSAAIEKKLMMYVVTNPPFSKKEKILQKLQELGLRNLALLLPSATVSNKYWKRYFPHDNFQIFINTGRCKFLDPLTHEPIRGSSSFTIFWCLNNFHLPNDLNYF